MKDSVRHSREKSFGDAYDLTVVDRLGRWLGRRKVERVVGGWEGKEVLDVGCGFDAHATAGARETAASLTLIDVTLAPDLDRRAGVTSLEGVFPGVAADLVEGSFDVILMLSVLEHVEDDREALERLYELLAPGGVLLLGVPTWAGKRLLEFSAFRLGLSSTEEMDDHRRYYNLTSLWPALVSAGFKPRHIRCRRFKFGLNLFAVCHKAV